MQGILFKPDVWKAKLEVLELGEAQTRRLDGLKEINLEPDRWRLEGQLTPDMWSFTDGEKHIGIKPPYHIGETYYVKEAWRPDDTFKGGGIPRLGIQWGEGVEWKLGNPHQEGKWRSSFFMPAWAARHFITITGIKAERVQEITEEDAVVEGMTGRLYREATDSLLTCSRDVFHWYWDSLDPRYPWDSNPWNFAYTLKLVERDV